MRDQSSKNITEETVERFREEAEAERAVLHPEALALDCL